MALQLHRCCTAAAPQHCGNLAQVIALHRLQEGMQKHCCCCMGWLAVLIAVDGRVPPPLLQSCTALSQVVVPQQVAAGVLQTPLSKLKVAAGWRALHCTAQ